jgi:heme-degrading monooxygenase HmoA
MPVTEFSRLTFKRGLSEDKQASARQGLSRAKQLMETFTGHDFYILQEIEDPNHIYIVGQWASVEHHMNTWIPSEANQGLLKDLGSLVEVDFLFHIDVSVGSIPPSKEAPIFSIGKHVMDSGKRPGFEDTFNSRRSSLEAHAQGSISGGWRIEKEPGREEFVLFVPWKYVSRNTCHHPVCTRFSTATDSYPLF